MGILDGVKGAAGSARSGIGRVGGGIKSGAQNINVKIQPAAQKVWSGAQAVGGGIQKAGGGAKAVAIGGAGLMGGLALGALGKSKRHSGNLIILLSFALFLFDRTVGYKGFYITGVGSFFEILKLFTSVLYVVGVWAMFYFFMSRDRSPRALFTFVSAMIVLVITIALAFRLDRLSILHVGFILLLWFTFIKGREDAPQANLLLIGLLIADLYLYSIVMAFAPQFAQYVSGIPILFFLTLSYVYQETNSKLAWALIFSVALWYFITLGPSLAQKLDLANIEGVETRLPSWNEFWDKFRKKNIDEPITQLSTGIEAWLKKQIEYATKGKVEEVKEPLGAYLVNVKPADPRYYEDENVIVWGTVLARTLDDPINIQTGCFVDKFDERQGKPVRIFANKTDPKNKFSVFTSEEQDFVCEFNKCCEGKECNEKVRSSCTFKTGSNIVTAFADFNFETLAQLKVYFIDKGRQRAMARENQDPFVEFKINDKNPVASYTSGPAEVGMGTTNSLISVSDSYIAYPAIDFSLKNREGWQGNINSLKELVLFLPDGVELTDPNSNVDEPEPCNEKFDLYSIDDCKASCTTFVFDECEKVCGGYKDGTDSKNKCISTCPEMKTKCDSTCDLLFEGYNAYSLDLTDISVRNEMVDFDKLKGFRCRFKLTPSEVLGSSPITTKFFRVKARYNYTVLSPVSVNIVNIPEVRNISRVTGGEGGSGGGDYTGTNDMVKMIYEVAGNNELGEVMAVGAGWESSWNPLARVMDTNGVESCGLFQFNLAGKGYGKTCEYWLNNPEEEAAIIKPDYDRERNKDCLKAFNDENGICAERHSAKWYCLIVKNAEGNALDCNPGSSYMGRMNSIIAAVQGTTSTMTA